MKITVGDYITRVEKERHAAFDALNALLGCLHKREGRDYFEVRGFPENAIANAKDVIRRITQTEENRPPLTTP